MGPLVELSHKEKGTPSAKNRVKRPMTLQLADAIFCPTLLARYVLQRYNKFHPIRMISGTVWLSYWCLTRSLTNTDVITTYYNLIIMVTEFNEL